MSEVELYPGRVSSLGRDTIPHGASARGWKTARDNPDCKSSS
jgi:hypothetical protein